MDYDLAILRSNTKVPYNEILFISNFDMVRVYWDTALAWSGSSDLVIMLYFWSREICKIQWLLGEKALKLAIPKLVRFPTIS